jgi:hypothetical protein
MRPASEVISILGRHQPEVATGAEINRSAHASIEGRGRKSFLNGPVQNRVETFECLRSL